MDTKCPLIPDIHQISLMFQKNNTYKLIYATAKTETQIL